MRREPIGDDHPLLAYTEPTTTLGGRGMKRLLEMTRELDRLREQNKALQEEVKSSERLANGYRDILRKKIANEYQMQGELTEALGSCYSGETMAVTERVTVLCGRYKELKADLRTAEALSAVRVAERRKALEKLRQDGKHA